MSESLIELTRRLHTHASRVNPESPSRKELRRLLRWHELEVAAALLALDDVAQDDTFDALPYALRRSVRDALHPLWERRR